MSRGGARSRSGPQKQEGSRTSERAGYVLTALPPAGYDGEVPDLGLYLPGATDRHRAVWAEHWTFPQACAWSEDHTRWPEVADLVKWIVRSEADDAPVGTATNVKQLRESVGIGPVGLKLNGWKIADLDPAPASAPEPDEDEDDPRNRLTVVPDAEAG